MTLKPHAYAELFPMIEGEAFAQFAADVKENGLREKIVLLDGLILDGRNRYGAAVLHDLPAAHGDADSFRDFDPEIEGDPLKWVLSKNLARRHLNEGQRAMVADHLATMRQGERTDLEPSANLQKVDQATAASMLHVSTRSVASARKVRESGTLALVQLVEQGILPVSQGEKAAKLAPQAQAEVVALAKEGKANVVRTVIKQGARDARETALGAKLLALPDKKYGVILGDPEWEFVVWSNITGLDRSAVNHYAVSPWGKISARDVQKIAAKDCILCLWVTDLERGLAVMKAWGFEYKSYFVWVKDIVPAQAPREAPGVYETVGAAGTGYWNRDRDEILLIGTRGKPVAPAPGTQGESVWFAARPKFEGTQRGRHSAKPDCAHRWIEQHYPNVPKIELNARAARAGWDVWGYEAPAGCAAPEATVSENDAVSSTGQQVDPDRAKEILARHSTDPAKGEKADALPPEAQAVREDRSPRWKSNLAAVTTEASVAAKPPFDGDRDMPDFLRRT